MHNLQQPNEVICRRALGRDATSREREIVLKFLEQEKDQAKAWTQILHGLYASLISGI